MKKIIGLLITSLVLVLSSATLAQFSEEGCIRPLPELPTHEEDIFTSMTEILKKLEDYRATRESLNTQAADQGLGAQFFPRLETTSLKLLATNPQDRTDYIEKLTSCLVGGQQITVQESKLLVDIVTLIGKRNHPAAARTMSDFVALPNHSAVGSAIADYLGDQEEPSAEKSVGAGLGIIVGGVVGAAAGYIVGGPPGAAIGAAIGAAAGKEFGDAYEEGNEDNGDGNNGSGSGDGNSVGNN